MIRAFFRDSAIYAVPSIVSRGLSVLLVPLYTRVLKPADYGAWDMLLVFGNLISLTVALEVSQGVARYYSSENDIDKKILYASSALWFTVFCYAIFLVSSLILAPILSRSVIGADGFEKMFRVGMLSICLNGLFYFIQNQFRWELRSKGYTAVSLLATFVTACVAVLFAYALEWGLLGILLGMIAGASVGCINGFWSLRNSLCFRFQWARLREMLAFSAPLVPSGIAVFVSLYVDRLMINHFLSLEAVGLYGIAFRLASTVGLVMVGFQGALTPLIYAHYHEAETPGQIAVIFRLFVAFSLIIYLLVSAFAKELLWIMTTPAYYSAAHLVTFLVPSIVLSNMYIFAPGIAIAKKTRSILSINLTGALFMTILNCLLIPPLGVIGAAVAKLVGYATVFMMYMLVSQRLYRIPYRWKPLASSVVVIAAFAYAISRIDIGTTMDAALKCVLIGGACVALLATGLVTQSEIVKAYVLARQRLLRGAWRTG